MNKNKLQRNSKKGFTLIELMVSLGLFAVVMTLSASSMLTILDANAKSQSSSAVMTNLNIALDGMTREIRTGTGYTCDDNDDDYECEGKQSFQFTTQEGVRTEYAYNSSTKKITKTNLTDNGPAISIIADEVTITDLSFFGRGFEPYAESGEQEQPFLQIIVQGEAGLKDRLRTKFDIQTSVSQRLLDSLDPVEGGGGEGEEEESEL